jgi:hypothetical protein
MRWGIRKFQTRLYIICAIILLGGLVSAGVIYLTAGTDSGDVLGYEMVGGEVYQIRPEESKMYKHDLEVYGGKANVLADEFMRWFIGLWHGKSLAVTVACISIFVSFGFFFVAYRLSHLKADSRDDNNSGAA